MNTQPTMRMWKISQGTSTLRVRAADIQTARERAAGCGFKDPQSIVLDDEPPRLTPEQAGKLARVAYRARCEKFDREIDPVAEDNEYWRAYRAAEGRQHYAGD